MPHPVPDTPKLGQESVWDYPRPAVAESTPKRLQVILGGRVIADTTRGVRTLETSHPPTYYFPPEDIADGALKPVDGRSLCEWKGQARYFDVLGGDGRYLSRAAWAYPDPTPAFRPLTDYVAFMPQQMDRCIVDGEIVRPQDGDFYGGWITDDLAGPFKGGPGTWGW